jgi:hypothetical protein
MELFIAFHFHKLCMQRITSYSKRENFIIAQVPQLLPIEFVIILDIVRNHIERFHQLHPGVIDRIVVVIRRVQNPKVPFQVRLDDHLGMHMDDLGTVASRIQHSQKLLLT